MPTEQLQLQAAIQELASSIELLSWIAIFTAGFLACIAYVPALMKLTSEYSSRRFHDTADKLYLADRLTELIDYCRKELASNPNSSDPHWYLALAYYLKHDFDQATLEFRSAIRLNPHYREAAEAYLQEMERNGDDRAKTIQH